MALALCHLFSSYVNVLWSLYHCLNSNYVVITLELYSQICDFVLKVCSQFSTDRFVPVAFRTFIIDIISLGCLNVCLARMLNDRMF